VSLTSAEYKEIGVKESARQRDCREPVARSAIPPGPSVQNRPGPRRGICFMTARWLVKFKPQRLCWFSIQQASSIESMRTVLASHRRPMGRC
jgi:hypothetical protein